MAMAINRLQAQRPVQLPSRLIAAFVSVCAFAVALSPPASAQQWKAVDHEAALDDGGDPIRICDDGYRMTLLWSD
jgi:hypothetical protein